MNDPQTLTSFAPLASRLCHFTRARSAFAALAIGAMLGAAGCAASAAPPEDRSGATTEAITSESISISPDGKTIKGVGFPAVYNPNTVVQIFVIGADGLWTPVEQTRTSPMMINPPHGPGVFSAPRPPTHCGSMTYYAAEDLTTGRWSNMVPYLNSCILHAP